MLLLFVVASIRACISYCLLLLLFVAAAFCCCCNLLLLIFLLVAIFSFCCLLLLLLFVHCICYLLLLQVVAVASCCCCYLLAYSRTPSSKFFTVRTRVRNQANLSPSTASTRSCQKEIYTASGSLLFIQACTLNVPFFVFICAEQHNIPRLYKFIRIEKIYRLNWLFFIQPGGPKEWFFLLSKEHFIHLD